MDPREERDRRLVPSESFDDYDFIVLLDDGIVLMGTYERGVTYAANFGKRRSA